MRCSAAAWAFLLGLALAAGCRDAAKTEPANAEPAQAEAEEAEPLSPIRKDAVKIRGTVEGIHLRNINKAKGHYTYNVEIDLRHQPFERTDPFDPETIADPLTVRVGKIFWKDLSPDDQKRLAPDGPQQELTVQKWHDLEAGQQTALRVVFTSPDLAQRVD